jgi:hypothetical protein
VVIAATFAVSLLAVGALLSSCGSAATDPTGAGSTGTGWPTTTVVSSGLSAAPQFSGATLDGTTVTLDQYRGKPLFLVYMTSG